jgi:hypothetical protein
MMRSPKRLLHSPAILILLVGFWLNASAASAQVPYDMAYQGRLTDAVGAPLVGPVNLSMRIYDVIAGGSALYIEDHANVAVDDVGAFSVKLGAGTAILGTFDSALFAGVNRYLEVVVDGEVLVPRLVMGSVPYAMQAESAPNAEAAANAAQTTADSALADATAAQSTAVAANATSIAAQSAANAAVASAASNATAISANTVDTSANTTGISTNATAITGEGADRAAADAANATALAALEARIAALEPEPCFTRFCACSDGVTVEDTATGLLWERKTTTGAVHGVNNPYTWSSTGTAADGTAYTVFLPGLNGSSFAGHTDWRLPIISELQSILVGPGVETVANADPADPLSGLNATGQAVTCAGPPCIDPQFAAVGGPVASGVAVGDYWSASSFATDLSGAWFARFYFGSVSSGGGCCTGFPSSKLAFGLVRAVRTGSCSS